MSPPASTPTVRGRLRRLRVDVGTLVSSVVLLQSLLLIGLGYWGAQRLVSTIGESAHSADHARIEDKTIAFLANAGAVVDAMGAAPNLQAAGEHSEQSAQLLWVLLQQSQSLDALYVADEFGRMLLVTRRPVPAVRRILREGAGHSTETWEFKQVPGDDAAADAQKSYRTERIEALSTAYDPLARGWFKLARAGNKPVWTAPYVFAASQELGVTYAQPARRRDGEGVSRTMVVAGDVTLGRLSDFVRQFSRAGYGDSALLGPDFNVLAQSDRPGSITALAPPGDGVLGAIHAAMLANGSARGTASTAFALEHGGRRYLVKASRIPATGWRLVSWVPEDKILGGLRRGVLWSLVLVLALLVTVLLLSLWLARRLTTPVENLSRVARRIGRLELENLPREHSRVLEIQHLDQALADSARSLMAFRKFVPVDALKELLAQGHTLTPSGSARELTVMFTDVQGFTSISEQVDTDALVQQLTEYFNLAASVIAEYGGTIDKYIGDGMMVLWGAPAPLPDAALRACEAALALQRALDVLNARWQAQGRHAFVTRIGIHTGEAVAGVLGSNDRLAYTAFGDAINVASRIEGANKQLGTRVLISEATFEALAGRLPARWLERITLRGRQAPMSLYELVEGPGAAANPPAAAP